VSKKLEAIANVAIIVLVVLISISLFYRRSRQSAEDPAGPSGALGEGKRMLAPAGYQWEQHSRTLLMALRYGCVHCERNMDLYRELEQKAGKGRAQADLLSVFPDDPYVAEHDIDQHGLQGLRFVANVDFDKLRLPGTPTLLLVDNHGTILHAWIGELSQKEQDEVMQAVQ